MDLYSNNGMLDWESNRRVAELRAMAARHEIDGPEKREEQHDAPFTAFGRAWHDLFQRTNHGYKSA